MFEHLQFRYPFRKYQRMILDTIVPENADNKYHIVAPPGSGKTIVGLELVRRFGQPAVIFAPTTTIQLQWREKLEMFTTDPAALETLVSVDPHTLAPINVFTYQLIAAPESSRQYLYEMAEKHWVADLIREGRVENETAARQRLAALQARNPAHYRREHSRRALAVKRRLLREPDADIAQFLHPNARRLIADLVAYGVRTVVLDECHHLLDYWAIVLRYLMAQIEHPRVIGLTATLPSPEGDEEFENYDALVGEVDFEVPAPAVVKEGDLAPYRDLVLFVRPTRREHRYLKNISEEFAAALRALTDRPAFHRWLERETLSARSPAEWAARWREKPLLMLAALRFLFAGGWEPDFRFPIPQDAREAMTLEDWLLLIEQYALDVLALSEAEEDHELLARLRDVLYGFGFTLTERGLRQNRSPGDMVLSFSESKDYGTARILKAEYEALGDRLRAVVVTDFERLNSAARRLDGVLARDAGSAWRVFDTLARDPDLEPLTPMLVTGRTVRCVAAHAEDLTRAINNALARAETETRCRAEAVNAHTARIVAKRGRWTPRLYVPILTDLFDAGVVKCLVGTRGILGEGWDAVKLNTLIDLTGVTTSTAVQQLRGRSLRKDPDWPHKVAHNWDVICIAPQFERGDLDFRRFLKRHARYWGLMLFAGARRESWLHPWHGRVVKGWPHVLPELMDWLHGFRRFDGLEKINAYMLKQVKRREWVYEMWKVGEDYSNFSYRTTQLHTKDLKMHTVFTLEKTVKRVLRGLMVSLVSGYLVFFRILGAVLNDWQTESDFVLLLLLVSIPLLGALVWAFRDLQRAFTLLLTGEPADAILLDVARATLSALRDTRLVSRNLQNDFIRVVETTENTYQVLVDYASPADSDAFARAMEQVFAPIVDQRYLIQRTDRRLPNLMLRPLWMGLRWMVRLTLGTPPSYYPVPDALAQRRKDADAFARHWARYVGGGKLIYTRTEAGRKILLEARAQRRPKTDALAFEFWR